METYKVAPNAAWRRVEDEIIILDLNTSIYYSLNETAARFWELLAEGLPTHKVVERAILEYETSSATLKKDLENLLEQFRRENLLVPAAP